MFTLFTKHFLFNVEKFSYKNVKGKSKQRITKMMETTLKQLALAQIKTIFELYTIPQRRIETAKGHFF